MTASDTLERDTAKAAVVKALEENLGRTLDDLDESTSLLDELALDSTGVLGVLISLEDSLDLEIDPDIITEEHLATLGGLVDCVMATAKNG
jgi:acyl carrier protein